MNTQPPSNSAETILFAALDHAPEDREACLITACGEDAALLAEVRALLAAHEAMPESFLAEPAINDILERDLDVTIKAAPGTLPRRSGGRPADADDLLSDDLQTIVTARPSGSQTSAGSSTANPSAPVPFIFGKRIAQGAWGRSWRPRIASWGAPSRRRSCCWSRMPARACGSVSFRRPPCSRSW